jgi:NADH dehydrogenase
MILITGGTGVIGTKLVEQWLQEGKRVRLLALPSDTTPLEANENVEVWYGDISNKEDIRGICDGVSAVYHLAAVIMSFDESVFKKVNLGGTKNILEEAKKANVEHFVYISSASVTYPKPTEYSLSKRDSEELVKKSRLNYTIIRPTLVYDKKGGLELETYLDFLKKFPIIPFIGKGDAIKRPVYVDDIVEGLLAIQGNNKAYNKTYNFSGGEEITILDFTRMCLKLMGMPRKPIVHLPVWYCLFLANIMKIFMKRPPLRWQIIAGMTQHANLDPLEAQKDLGYKAHRVSDVFPGIREW